MCACFETKHNSFDSECELRGGSVVNVFEREREREREREEGRGIILLILNIKKKNQYVAVNVDNVAGRHK